MTFRHLARRLALLLVGLGWLALAHPLAQTAPVIQWTHSGTNVTHFQIVIGTTGTWVVDAGLPTPSGTTYEYALPALPAGQWQVKVRACYGADCQDSAAMTVVKMVPAGSTALNYYWVSPTGTATWANCKSDTPLSGIQACKPSTANTSAVAGDTVWFRGGSGGNYLITSKYGTAVSPSNSGTCASPPCLGGVGASPITFQAHPNETPILEQETLANYAMGLNIDGKNWIRVIGLTFHNFTWYGARFVDEASYNEMAYCQITSDSDFQTGYAVVIGDVVKPSAAVHNYLHHNYISSKRATNPCGESVDLVRLGNNISDPESEDHYTTFSHNYLEYAGHSLLQQNSRFNAVVGNIAHNEPWLDDCAIWKGYEFSQSTITVSVEDGKTATLAIPRTAFVADDPVTLTYINDESISMTGTVVGLVGGVLTFNVSSVTGSGTYEGWIVNKTASSTSLTVGTGSKSLTVPYAYLSAGGPVGLYSASNYAEYMKGTVTSYTRSTGALVANITSSSGSGQTHADWIVSDRILPIYTDPTYNLKFAHRIFALGQQQALTGAAVRTVIEGNRLGFGSTNPGNGGSSVVDLEARKQILRFNDIYAGMHSGVYFKYANSYGEGTGSGGNHVYQNTIYHNGHGWNASVYGVESNAYNGRGIAQYNAGTTDPANVVVNNIVYGNGFGDICYLGLTVPCSPYGFDTVLNNWTTDGSGQGDPAFTNPVLTDPTSQNLIPTAHGYTTSPTPDLTLRGTSGAINGTNLYLTLANGAGTNETTLVVDDAGFFQDGSEGSDLARGVTFVPDWIAIGTVDNVVEIDSIDYATNTITLASAKTWADNAPIWLYKKSDGVVVLVGSAPDYGAHEYGAGTASAPTGVVVR